MKRLNALIILTMLIFTTNQPTFSNVSQPAKPLYIHWVDWSPDGSKVALTTDDGIRIYDLNFQQIQFFPFSDPNIIPYALWSPDSTWLTAGEMILDAATLKPLVKTTSPFSFMQWTPDSKFVTRMAIDYLGLEIYDAQTGNLVKTLSANGLQMSYPGLLSPDGSRFLTRDHTNTIVIADAIKGGIIARFDRGHATSFMVWSPDGKRIAYLALAEVPVGTPGSIALAGSDTLAVLYFVSIIDATNGQTLQKSEPLPNGVNGFSWSPDGNNLIGVSAHGLIYTWDTLTGQLIDTFLAPGRVTTGDFSPYGGRYTIALNLGGPPLDSRARQAFTPRSKFTETFLDGMIQIAVPAPSLEKLQAITERCKVQSAVQQALTTQIQSKQLTAFIQQVSALTDAQIPPGCKADLLAVAQALQAKQ
jgi:dipeptidyl aminopeptidase/acylaminoacyl peptidase